MKRFASMLVCTLLVALMVFSTVASVAAFDTSKKATLTLYKYETDKAAEEAGKKNDSQKAVKGATYTAYKIASLKSDGTFELASDYSGVTGLSDLFKTDGSLTYKSTSDFEEFIPALRKVIENSTTIKGSEAETDGNGKAEIKNLDLGIYLVLETKIPDNFVETSKPFLVQLPQWDQKAKNGEGDWLYNVTAYPKDDPITLTKVIVENNKEKKETTRGIGSVVDYKITVDIPYYGTLTEAQEALIKYYLTDIMSEGLTFNKSSVEVSVVNPANEEDVIVSDYKAFDVSTAPELDDASKATGSTVITIDFAETLANQKALHAQQGYKFVIKYTAVLNEKAAIGSANTNVAKVTFTTNPRTGKVVTDPETGEPVTDPDGNETPETKTDDTEKDSTKVYTYGFDLDKKFNDGKDKPNATAVEFSLKDSDNAKIFFITEAASGEKKNTGVYYTYAAAMDAKDSTVPAENALVTLNGVNYIVTQKLTPDKDGNLTLYGLNVGTYTLTEEKTVSGYSKLESDILLKVTAGENSGKLDGTVSATANGKALTANQAGKVGVFEMEINNVSEQFNLPQTGGAGLLAFTIGGGIVIAGSIIMFSLLRKKKTSK